MAGLACCVSGGFRFFFRWPRPPSSTLFPYTTLFRSLGDVGVDEEFARALVAASPLVGPDHAAHTGEHAVEVELPFLQVRRADVRLVPLVLAWGAGHGCLELGAVVAGLVGPSRAAQQLVASSD